VTKTKLFQQADSEPNAVLERVGQLGCCAKFLGEQNVLLFSATPLKQELNHVKSLAHQWRH